MEKESNYLKDIKESQKKRIVTVTKVSNGYIIEGLSETKIADSQYALGVAVYRVLGGDCEE